MSVTFLGHALVSELLANPSRFTEQGRSYDLLQDYFRGYPVRTLRPLLASRDLLVQRAALWIASELGEKACSLLREVIPLVDSRDRYIKYHALLIVIVCAIGENVNLFIHVARSLESEDEVIRVLAMRLLANADQSQLKAGSILARDGGLSEAHRRGLGLLSRCNALEAQEVRLMLCDGAPLARRYGAVAAKRLLNKLPGLINAAAVASDADVSRFAKEALEDAARGTPRAT